MDYKSYIKPPFENDCYDDTDENYIMGQRAADTINLLNEMLRDFSNKIDNINDLLRYIENIYESSLEFNLVAKYSEERRKYIDITISEIKERIDEKFILGFIQNNGLNNHFDFIKLTNSIFLKINLIEESDKDCEKEKLLDIPNNILMYNGKLANMPFFNINFSYDKFITDEKYIKRDGNFKPFGGYEHINFLSLIEQIYKRIVEIDSPLINSYIIDNKIWRTNKLLYHYIRRDGKDLLKLMLESDIEYILENEEEYYYKNPVSYSDIPDIVSLNSNFQNRLNKYFYYQIKNFGKNK